MTALAVWTPERPGIERTVDGRRIRMTAFEYEIHVEGLVPVDLLEEFEGVRVTVQPVGTILGGAVADQGALHNLINRMQGLGLELVEVRRLRKGCAAPAQHVTFRAGGWAFRGEDTCMTEWNPHCPVCGRKLRLEGGASTSTSAVVGPQRWRCGAGHVWPAFVSAGRGPRDLFGRNGELGGGAGPTGTRSTAG